MGQNASTNPAIDIDSVNSIIEQGREKYRSEEFKAAVDKFYTALQIAEKEGYTKEESICVNNIAAIFYHQRNYQKALEYFERSYQIDEAKGDVKGMASTLNNMAIANNSLGNYKAALDFYGESIELKEQLQDTMGIATSLNNMGLVYFKVGDYERAIKLYKESLETIDKLENNWKKANTNGNLARAYLKKGEPQKALFYADNALILAKKDGSKHLIFECYMTLESIYYELGWYKDAYKALSYKYSYHDSIFSVDKDAMLTDLRVKYEMEQKEKENEVLKQEKATQKVVIRNQIIIGIAIIVVLFLVLFIAFILYISNLQRKDALSKMSLQKEELDLQKNELERLDLIKSKLFSIISHELRGPLNSLSGTISLLQQKRLTREELSKIADEVQVRLHQTNSFLNNLLMWAKSQMGGISGKPESFDVKLLVMANVALLDDMASKKGVRIENAILSEQYVYADYTMIELVIRNLISNAIKFTRQGDVITISAHEEKDQLVLEVCDTGIGISKENQEKLFSLDTFTTQGTAQEMGTGLGLMLCKNFVEANQGKIWLRSKLGNGSAFYISLPYGKVTQAQA